MIRSNLIQIAFLTFATFCFSCWVSFSFAQEEQYESNHLSREELAEILKSGDILSLEQIISFIHKEKEDRMLEVELLNYDGVLIYQIEILTAKGVVVTYYLDGKTGQDASSLLEG
ncbi:MAG: PepSY domain-containing protein [Kordiimonadaceae bacterium]|nr:PepSY domain-containing protein [Kordiimonadaceae bacterium]